MEEQVYTNRVFKHQAIIPDGAFVGLTSRCSFDKNDHLITTLASTIFLLAAMSCRKINEGLWDLFCTALDGVSLAVCAYLMTLSRAVYLGMIEDLED